MKKFHFKLERLLEARLAKEKGVKQELAKVISEQNIFRMKQNDYRNRVDQQKRMFHEKMVSGKVSFAELSGYHRFEDFSGRVIEDSQKKIEDMEPAINVIRVRLTEAQRERRVIEKLKEKRFDEWKYQANRAENIEIDDMNQKLFMRRIVSEMQERRHD